MAELVMFESDEHSGALVPRRDAAGSWNQGTTVRGMAVSAALAREAERLLAAHDLASFTPGRWTVDLSRPVGLAPFATRGTLLRRGRRIAVLDLEVVQHDQVVSRARAVFLRPGNAAPGKVWEPSASALPPPPLHGLDRTNHRLHWLESTGWTPMNGVPDRSMRRNCLWEYPFLLVAGEAPTPFPFVAGVADLASVATQTGDSGLRHINVDLSLHLIRVPADVQRGLGVGSIHRAAQEGLAIGTALLYDHDGPIGTATVTTIENATHASRGA